MKTKKYGLMVYAARVHLNMNQCDLANAWGVSQSKVSKVEDDKLEPSATELIWLVDNLITHGDTGIYETLFAVLGPAREQIRLAEVQAEHGRGLHKKPHPECKKCERLAQRFSIKTSAALLLLALFINGCASVPEPLPEPSPKPLSAPQRALETLCPGCPEATHLEQADFFKRWLR